MKNKLGQNLEAGNASWTFDNDVWKNFDKHINKSIPLYLLCHKLGLEISDFFLEKNSKTIDLGCSTGTFIKKLNARHNNKNLKINGYDSVKKMVQAAKNNNKNKKNISILKKDIVKDKILNNVDLITSFFTLSFVKPAHRQEVFNKIFNSLNWGGGFIFFDKVRAPDARFQDIMTQIYTNYKIDRNFSPNEILNKSKSLKGVLEPYSTRENFLFLKRAGFKDYMTIFKCITFEGFLAIK
ncbi:methyltransferase domain-containing protein [Candidatus Pelagibacter sp. HIMB1709]|uniref:methyltransferase domain-containing protein n=1 Tax=Candidatus Pelagibacter sp. HIMB1709 TaxID=3413367 RepID=UPI003F87AC3B